jgi:hypothetical protein
MVSDVKANIFRTIEGNTKDQGAHEGYEVAARTRNYAKKDFLRLSA